MSNEISNRVETVTLYEEYRLIEKDEAEINAAWRGVHLLLFFLAFVFGSFCTFCFHMLMYLFDEKCVLFPKLISLKEMGKGGGTVSNKLLYDYISDSDPDALPVDFVSTQWVEKSTCYLPTYAPLLSGICGLIWTTMFVMCSSGSRSLTGLQRAWRILPTVFVFSLAMGGFSIYTSFITQAGLDELCLKFGEITGSKTCSYTINVATLAYERRIRGVYQATRLTIMSAWLHTFCWLGAAFTALLRMILVVDFRLVKVQVDLRGNIEKMLERHEKHIRTDEFLNKDDLKNIQRTGRTSTTSVKVRFVNKGFGTEPQSQNTTVSRSDDIDLVTNEYISPIIPIASCMSLQPEEFRKLLIRSAAASVNKKHEFLVEILHDIVDKIGSERHLGAIRIKTESDLHLRRQKGVSSILHSFAWSPSSSSETDESTVNREEAEQVAQKFRRHFLDTSASKIAASVRKLREKSVQTDAIEKNTSPEIVNRWDTSETSIQTLVPDIQSIILPLVESENTMIIPTVTSQEIEKLTSSFKKVDGIEHKDVQVKEQMDDAAVTIWEEIRKEIADIRSSKSLVNLYFNPQKPGPSKAVNENLSESGSKNLDVSVDSKLTDLRYSESGTSKEKRHKTQKPDKTSKKEKQD